MYTQICSTIVMQGTIHTRSLVVCQISNIMYVSVHVLIIIRRVWYEGTVMTEQHSLGFFARQEGGYLILGVAKICSIALFKPTLPSIYFLLGVGIIAAPPPPSLFYWHSSK